MCLCEMADRADFEHAISQPLCDRQGAGPGNTRFVQFAEVREGARYKRQDLASSAVVVEALGERFGLAQRLQ
jgi:hypothetical protein